MNMQRVVTPSGVQIVIDVDLPNEVKKKIVLAAEDKYKNRSDIIPSGDTTNINISAPPPVSSEKPPMLDAEDKLFTAEGVQKEIPPLTMPTAPADATSVASKPMEALQLPPEIPSPKLNVDYNFQDKINYSPNENYNIGNIKPNITPSDVPASLATGQALTKDIRAEGERKAQEFEAGNSSTLENLMSVLISKEALADYYRTGDVPLLEPLSLPARTLGAVTGQGEITNKETSLLAYPKEKMRDYISSYFKNVTREQMKQMLQDKITEIENDTEIDPDIQQKSLGILIDGLKDIQDPLSTKISKGYLQIVSDLILGAAEDPSVLATLGGVGFAKGAKNLARFRSYRLRNTIGKIEDRLLSKGITPDAARHIGSQPEGALHPVTGKVMSKTDYFTHKVKKLFRQPNPGGNVKLKENSGDPLLKQITELQDDVPGSASHKMKPIQELNQADDYERELGKADIDKMLRDLHGETGPTEIPRLNELEDTYDWVLKNTDPLDANAELYAKRLQQITDDIQKGWLTGPELRERIQDLNRIASYMTRTSETSKAQQAAKNLADDLRTVMFQRINGELGEEWGTQYQLLRKQGQAKYARLRQLQKIVLGGYKRTPKRLTEQGVIEARKRLTEYIESVGKDWVTDKEGPMELLMKIDQDFGTNMSQIAKDYGAAHNANIFKGMDLKSGRKVSDEATAMAELKDEATNPRNYLSPKMTKVGMFRGVKRFFGALSAKDKMTLIEDLRKYDAKLAWTLQQKSDAADFDSVKKLLKYFDDKASEFSQFNKFDRPGSKGKVFSKEFPPDTPKRYVNTTREAIKNEKLLNIFTRLEEFANKIPDMRGYKGVKALNKVRFVQQDLEKAISNQQLDEEMNPELMPAE